jgi:hypothetical protein
MRKAALILLAVSCLSTKIHKSYHVFWCVSGAQHDRLRFGHEFREQF